MGQPAAMWKQIVLSLCLAAGAAGAWHEQAAITKALGLAPAEAQAPAAAPPSGVPVISVDVVDAADSLVFEAVGTGRAARSITLRAEAQGTVTQSEIEADRRFEAGDLLLALDERKERLALALAQTEFADANRTLDRFTRLQTSGTAALATLDEAQTAAAVARLAVERAREALADRRLTAPFDGVTGLPMVEVGDRVESGDAVASFDDRASILVELDLPETLLARVGRGTGVEATTPAYPGRVFEGAVVAVDSRVDPVSRTARLRVALPNEEDLLRPGASFALSIRVPGAQYPAVPELALQFTRGGLHVWLVREGRARQVPVRLVRRRQGMVLVDGALSPGDSVVIEGTQRLREGRAVRRVGDEVLGTVAEGS